MSQAQVINRVVIVILAAIGLFVVGQLIELRPVIGIPNHSRSTYAEAVRKAGGKPVMLAYDLNQIPDHIEKLDGVLFPGGADIPPSLYGDEEIHPTVKLVSEERLNFEMALAKAWLSETSKPFLGVCLGCQLLNVAQGGSLIQDIPSEFGTNHREDHDITIEPGSNLYSIVGTDSMAVNSSHHQAVRELGEGLEAVARSPDGLIEAIEMTDDRFVMGVQWHPEKMKEDVQQQKIFESFVRASRKKSAAP